jgi:hypothetical protein
VTSAERFEIRFAPTPANTRPSMNCERETHVLFMIGRSFSVKTLSWFTACETGGYSWLSGLRGIGLGFSCRGPGSLVVVEVLEGVDPLGDFIDAYWQIGAGEEPVSLCAIPAFDSAVELWRSRRQHIERQLFVGARLFEFSHEL